MEMDLDNLKNLYTKRYKINKVTNEIECATFVCEHPHSMSYVIVLDMYEEPVRMTIKEAQAFDIITYEEAKIKLIECLEENITYWKSLISNEGKEEGK